MPLRAACNGPPFVGLKRLTDQRSPEWLSLRRALPAPANDRDFYAKR